MGAWLAAHLEANVLENFKCLRVTPHRVRNLWVRKPNAPIARVLRRAKDIEEKLMWDTQYNIAWHHNLVSIDLSFNRLQKFPNILSRLVTLCDIDVSGNQIIELPAEIRYLSRLTTFKANGNPLSSPTMAVVDDGVETYLVQGSEEHFIAMGTYRKTHQWCDGHSVFELVKRGTVSKLFFSIVNKS